MPMQSDPEPEAKNTDKADPSAKPTTVPAVANPDQEELGRKTAAANPWTPENAPSLDRLDMERAADEGMAPTSAP